MASNNSTINKNKQRALIFQGGGALELTKPGYSKHYMTTFLRKMEMITGLYST